MAHDGEEMRRPPHVDEPFLQVAPRRRMPAGPSRGARVPDVAACVQREKHARRVEQGDDQVRRTHPEKGDEARAGQRARDARRVLRRALHAHRADELRRRHRRADDAARMPTSDGLTRPNSPAITKTCTGVSTPRNESVMIVAARTA